ncbi:MAG: DNA polymerase III subunit chi [Chlamydiae bacterium]|nr:DNA polymerase III subunit chi [Chlamydiota bacterium]
MNVTLFSIQKRPDKASRIWTLCKKAIEKKIYLQIICPQQKTVEFVDNLLWQSPLDSFVPHALEHDHGLEPILITQKTEIKKPFTHILWLNKNPPPLDLKWVHLYDFDDQSSTESAKESSVRYHFYKENGCKISLLP